MVYKVAVIGFGNIGFKFSYDEKRTGTWSHVDAYNKCPSTTLVGAVEIDKTTMDLLSDLVIQPNVLNCSNLR